MTSTRLFRILVCALVICSLLINCSPIRAEATMVEVGTIVTVSGLAVIATVMGGLGVAQAAAIGSTALRPIAESCLAHLQELGLCQETTIDVFGVTPSLIEAIRSWLFDNDVLVDTGAQSGYLYYNGVLLPALPTYDSAAYPYLWIYCSENGSYMLGISPFEVYVNSAGKLHAKTAGRYLSYGISSNGSWYHAGTITRSPSGASLNSSTDTYIWTNFNLEDANGSTYMAGTYPVPVSSVESSYDLELGVVAPSTESLEIGYPDWYNNSTELTDPNTEKQVTVLPIPSVSTYENALSIPQDQIWQGINTGTNTGTDSGTSSDTWQPPSNPGQFALDLTKYFPFCIPFDLYDLFTCLNADPVAPVIHWELPMPGGSTYPIELDLSPFNSVAQLLRRMQLLLFCVGLAIKTRDLIKG